MKSAVLFGNVWVLLAVGSLTAAKAQNPFVQSCIPNSVVAGQTASILLKARYTNFSQFPPQVHFYPEIPILESVVKDAETILLKVEIPSHLSSNSLDVYVASGNQSMLLPNALAVIPATNTLSLSLELLPIQNISLSDFAVTNMANAPLIFNCAIRNDNQKRNLKAVLTISGLHYGLVGSAEKWCRNTPENAVIRFNNRNFDQYNLNTDNEKLIQAAAKTSTLPADDYQYKLELFDDKGQKLGEADADQTIANLITRPELIFPGSNQLSSSESVSNANPQFQWFSQASEFDFALYPVLPNQNSPEEILLNRPVFKKEGLKTTSFLYPSSAELLIPGNKYAWQIKAWFNSSRGRELLSSDIFFFSISTLSPTSEYSALQFVPNYLELQPNSATQLKLNLLDKQGAIFPVTSNNTPQTISLSTSPADRQNPHKVFLRCIPENAARISPNGVLTVSDKPASFAVFAEFNGLTEYASVVVKSKQKESSILSILFGLPNAPKH